uniref:Uncharacterized protein n=1 Tax=Arundo donax TaxID=35708 RepID=A0A0A9FHY8_ARUDO
MCKHHVQPRAQQLTSLARCQGAPSSVEHPPILRGVAVTSSFRDPGMVLMYSLLLGARLLPSSVST